MPDAASSKKFRKTNAKMIRLTLYLVVVLALFLWDRHRRAQFDYTVIPLTAEELEKIQASIQAAAESQARIDTLHALLDKAIAATEEPAESIRILDEILNTFLDDENAYIRIHTAYALVRKANLVDDVIEKKHLYETAVDKYCDSKERDIQFRVIDAFDEMLLLFDSNARKLDFCGRVLQKYESRMADRPMAWLLGRQAELTHDKQDKVAIYDAMLAKFLSSSSDAAFDRTIAAALRKMKLVDDPAEQLRLCDIVVDAFLKTPQRMRHYHFREAVEKKAELLNNPSLPLALWNQVIANSVTENAVVHARYERMALLKGDNERLAACDEFIAAHQNNVNEYVQLMVVRVMTRKACILSDSGEKTVLLRSIFEKCASITDSRARVVASDAAAMLAELDPGVASSLRYYDLLVAMPEQRRSAVRRLANAFDRVDCSAEELRRYDEAIDRGMRGGAADSLNAAAWAMFGKAERIDDEDEKIRLYDAILFDRRHICDRYLYSLVLRERTDLASDEVDRYHVAWRYEVMHEGGMEPDIRMLCLWDRIVVMHNAGLTDSALLQCNDIIAFCEEYLKNDENAYGLSPGKDFERASIMESFGRAILAKARGSMASGERANDGEVLTLCNKYLKYTHPEMPDFMNTIEKKIRTKRTELLDGAVPQSNI